MPGPAGYGGLPRLPGGADPYAAFLRIVGRSGWGRGRHFRWNGECGGTDTELQGLTALSTDARLACVWLGDVGYLRMEPGRLKGLREPSGQASSDPGHAELHWVLRLWGGAPASRLECSPVGVAWTAAGWWGWGVWILALGETACCSCLLGTAP